MDTPMPAKYFGLVVVTAVIAGFAGGVAGGWLLAGEPASAQSGHARLIEAEEFRLVEKDGRPCGRFHVDSSGRPAMLLFDKHSQVRAVLGVLPNGSPHMALSDKDGKVRVTLAVWPDARSGLFLSDGDDVPRARLAVLADGTPSLALSSQDGKTRAIFGSAPIEMLPSRDVRHRSESSVVLFDRDGKPLWSAP